MHSINFLFAALGRLNKGRPCKIWTCVLIYSRLDPYRDHQLHHACRFRRGCHRLRRLDAPQLVVRALPRARLAVKRRLSISGSSAPLSTTSILLLVKTYKGVACVFGLFCYVIVVGTCLILHISLRLALYITYLQTIYLLVVSIGTRRSGVIEVFS